MRAVKLIARESAAFSNFLLQTLLLVGFCGCASGRGKNEAGAASALIEALEKEAGIEVKSAPRAKTPTISQPTAAGRL